MKKGIKGIYLIERIETFPCEKKYYVGQGSAGASSLSGVG